ncbi:TRAP family transporter, partial [Alcanivorax marinus]|nr:TRAP family transporter [Alloalcanivorax marinus]
MNTSVSTVEEPAPQPEISRLGALFSWQSILFVVLCTAGLLTGLAYVFGLNWDGQRLLEGQYYWIFIGLFVAAAFIALPAYKGQHRIPFYDLAAAVVAMGISFYYSLHAWDMVQSGWAHVPTAVVIWLLMMELARRSGGLPVLLGGAPL